MSMRFNENGIVIANFKSLIGECSVYAVNESGKKYNKHLAFSRESDLKDISKFICDAVNNGYNHFEIADWSDEYSGYGICVTLGENLKELTEQLLSEIYDFVSEV